MTQLRGRRQGCQGSGNMNPVRPSVARPPAAQEAPGKALGEAPPRAARNQPEGGVSEYQSRLYIPLLAGPCGPASRVVVAFRPLFFVPGFDPIFRSSKQERRKNETRQGCQFAHIGKPGHCKGVAKQRGNDPKSPAQLAAWMTRKTNHRRAARVAWDQNMSGADGANRL